MAGPLLRRSDQAVLAAFGLLALVGMIGVLDRPGRPVGRANEIDEEEPARCAVR